MQNNGFEASRLAIRTSLKECGLDYIDLYLVHGPLGGPQMRRESWEACIEAQKEGSVRSIGVSNFGLGHLNEMLGYGLPLPSVNQVSQEKSWVSYLNATSWNCIPFKPMQISLRNVGNMKSLFRFEPINPSEYVKFITVRTGMGSSRSRITI
jgi:aryl-alcohol dehydrogenase-like predicted oxidoreductase